MPRDARLLADDAARLEVVGCKRKARLVGAHEIDHATRGSSVASQYAQAARLARVKPVSPVRADDPLTLNPPATQAPAQPADNPADFQNANAPTIDADPDYGSTDVKFQDRYSSASGGGADAYELAHDDYTLMSMDEDSAAKKHAELQAMYPDLGVGERNNEMIMGPAAEGVQMFLLSTIGAPGPLIEATAVDTSSVAFLNERFAQHVLEQNARLQKDLGLTVSENLLSSAEARAGFVIPKITYGKALERAVERAVRADPLLAPHLEYLSGAGNPDWVGRSALEGLLFDVTTEGGVEAHLARSYGENLVIHTYQGPF